MRTRLFGICLYFVVSFMLPTGPANALSPEAAADDVGERERAWHQLEEYVGAPAPKARADNIGESKLGLRKPVEIAISPDKIAWLKIDQSEIIEHQALAREAKRFLKNAGPYSDSLPLEHQHDPVEMEKLRMDAMKWRATYRQELRTVLKEQYYLWIEINRLAERVDQVHEDLVQVRQFFAVKISLKNGVSGVEQLRYHTNGYLDAKTIAEDLRKGAIKSLTVYTENRVGGFEDKKGTWVPCAQSCWISAFGY